MSQIASKNLYELLGNDPELDPSRPADPPTKAVDKPAARTGKRNPAPEAAAAPARDVARSAGARGGRQDGGRDQASGRSEQREGGPRPDRYAERGRGGPREGGRGRGGPRGGRGGSGRTIRDGRADRHSQTGVADHEKQAEKGWGGQDGEAEYNDEKAGEAIASEEIKEEAEANGEVAEPEPEDKTKSYDQYLKEQTEKKLALGSTLSTRKANEGSKAKFPEGTELRNEQEDFFVGGGGKKQREKELKQKDTLVLDGQYYAAPDSSSDRGGRGGRGCRGGGRGGRGDSRGERGDRGGRGRGRGEFRGAPRGDRDSAGGRGGAARGGFNATDASAFPALGA